MFEGRGKHLKKHWIEWIIPKYYLRNLASLNYDTQNKQKT